MPYKIKKVNNGFKLVDNKGIALSKKPLSLSKVKKQMIAVFLSKEKQKKGRGVREVFGKKPKT